MADPIKPVVFVVDDDASVRTALRRLFASVALNCEVYSDPSEFLDRAGQNPLGCVVLDLKLGPSSGLDLQRRLAELGSDLPIIIISGYADVPLTVRAMKGGALEVLAKPLEDQVLLDKVYEALEVARERRRERDETVRLRERFETLTSREREVMALVVTGMLNKQVAAKLGTTEKTIKVHRAQVMHKMGADSFASLVRMADRLRDRPYP